MNESRRSKVVKEIEKFLLKHKGHTVEVPPCADPFYFNLWCVTCEKEISVRGKARVNSRSSV
jgi:hypothetical protein